MYILYSPNSPEKWPILRGLRDLPIIILLLNFQGVSYLCVEERSYQLSPQKNGFIGPNQTEVGLVGIQSLGQ